MRIIFLLCIIGTLLLSTWAFHNEGKRNFKSALSTVHEVEVGDNPHLAVNILHNQQDIGDYPEQPRHFPVPNYPPVREQQSKNEFRSEGSEESRLKKEQDLRDKQLLNIEPEEQHEQLNQQQSIVQKNNTEEERAIPAPKQDVKKENVLHFQEKQSEVRDQEINEQHLGVRFQAQISKKPEMVPNLKVQPNFEPEDFNIRFQQENQGQNHHFQTYDSQKKLEKQNVDISQKQQNVDIPQNQQNVDIPQKQQNVEIPQNQQNVDIPQNQQNVEIPQQQQNVEIPQNQQNVDIPQNQQNVDIPQQQQNVDIPQKQQNVDIPQKQQNVDIPQKQQSVDIHQKQPNVEIPQNQQNIDIPQQLHKTIQDIQQNIAFPQQQNIQQSMMKDGQELQSHINKKHEHAQTESQARPLKESLPVVINWSIIGVRRDFNVTCSNNRRCLVTPNRDEVLRHDVLGIFFYGTEFAGDGLPLPRKPGHIWSVLHEESPKNNDWLFNNKGAMELFNLTATFKRESHYPFPTMWLKNPEELMSTEYVVPLEKKNSLRREGLAPVVFVHSDCSTPSDRSHYMQLLQKHLHIDSYGKCEHNKDFPKENLSFERGMGPMTSPDFYRVVAQYKFAFAFENAVCDDYVTEKFWRPLILGVVPIAFGSPRIKDVAPSNHSIINIRDFRSVQEVAEFIKYLDTHDEEYRKYIDFKRTGITNPVLKGFLERRNWGTGKQYGSQFSGFQCYICEKVHEVQEQMAAGLHTTRYQGTRNQYGCPLPNLFNEQGQYVVDDNFWWYSYSYGYYYLRSLQHHIDNNNNANIKDIHKFASKLQKNDKKNNIRPDV